MDRVCACRRCRGRRCGRRSRRTRRSTEGITAGVRLGREIRNIILVATGGSKLARSVPFRFGVCIALSTASMSCPPDDRLAPCRSQPALRGGRRTTTGLGPHIEVAQLVVSFVVDRHSRVHRVELPLAHDGAAADVDSDASTPRRWSRTIAPPRSHRGPCTLGAFSMSSVSRTVFLAYLMKRCERSSLWRDDAWGP